MNELETTSLVLEKCPSLSVGILGDFCLDLYLKVNTERSETSVETGLPTLPVEDSVQYPGGAGNVAMNLLDMKIGRVLLFGVLGDDMYGRQLRRILEKRGADCSSLLTQEENWHTHVYTKIIKEGCEQNRIDFGNFNSITDDISENLVGALEKELPSLDILIINQQQMRGIHSTALRTRVKKLLKRFPGKKVLLDSRHFADDFPGTMRKLNEEEARRVLKDHGKDTTPAAEREKEELLKHLYRLWGETVFLTLGEDGCLTYDGRTTERIWGLHFITPLDTVGAGDSMLAGIGAALGCGLPPYEAALFGNLAAGVTVRKLNRTGTAAPGEILELSRSPDYRYNPERANSPRNAEYLEDTEIEIITPLPETPAFRYAIFDHDGTVSTLRQGWEGIMKPMMVKAVLGEAYGGVTEKELEEIEKRIDDFIDKTTGVQTLVQMDGLTRLVQEYGYVKKEDIRDAQGYKDIYNADLVSMVEKRIGRFHRGERSIEDFTIKNALPFLEALREKGMELFLASGTDEKDVRKEAEALGYADLFTGGIFGAVGKIEVEPKRMVLERILEEIGRREGNKIITFGDGPVELRETKKIGGFAAGVASEEVRRYGFNPAKRKRLILAGADILIPDFSQTERILYALFERN